MYGSSAATPIIAFEDHPSPHPLPASGAREQTDDILAT